MTTNEANQTTKKTALGRLPKFEHNPATGTYSIVGTSSIGERAAATQGDRLHHAVCACGMKHRITWYRSEAVGPACDACLDRERVLRGPHLRRRSSR